MVATEQKDVTLRFRVTQKEADQIRANAGEMDLSKYLRQQALQEPVEGNCGGCGKRPYSTLTDQCPHCGADEYGTNSFKQELSDTHGWVHSTPKPDTLKALDAARERLGI